MGELKWYHRLECVVKVIYYVIRYGINGADIRIEKEKLLVNKKYESLLKKHRELLRGKKT